MNEPIRVLNVFMELDRGGAETFVMNVYRNIDRTKVQFDFLVHGNKIGAYEEEIQKFGGRIYRLPLMTDFFAYKKAIKQFFDNHPEYIIIHSHASELGLFIFHEAKKRGIPYRICHAHSAPQGVSVKSLLRYLFKKATTGYSNEFFACSDKAGIWQYGKHHQYTVVKNGISVKDFAFDITIREEVREQLGIHKKLVIGHVGRFEMPKNHSLIIDVFERVSNKIDSVLLLVGDGSLRSEIEKKVRDKGLTDKVFFLGSQQNVSKYLNAMDIFMFPSVFEGLGIVMIEAQANGLRSYVSDRIPPEAIVTDLVTKISLSQSPSQWAERMISDLRQTCNRKEYAVIVKDSGYDIEEVAVFFEEYYLDCSQKKL